MSLWLTLRKKLHDFFDRVPIARGDWDTHEFLHLAEITDRFHFATIKAQDKSVLDRDDLQQPIVGRREAVRDTQRKRRRQRVS